MLKTVLKILLISSILFNLIYGNDGVASISSKGIVFSKSDNISIEREILTISQNEIKVEYLFKNHSPKSKEILIAFPMPEIICDPFESMNYPENFKAYVNDKEIVLEKEVKAIVYTDNEKFEKDQNVTKLLIEKGIPLDCRNIQEVNQTFQKSMKTSMSVEYIKLMDLGLACCDPKMDPWSIYYKTEIKYYWKQIFQGNDTLRISHTYKPSLGYINGYYENDPGRKRIENNIEEYRMFYANNFKKDNTGATFTIEGKLYYYLNYILKTANTWKSPIKDFYLVIKHTGDLNVSTLSGPFELHDGNLLIHRKNFVPKEDLFIYFFQKKL